MQQTISQAEAYYGLSLASRLFDTMLRAIWVNGYVPKDPRLLAKAVRADLQEVMEALIPELLDQFVTLDSDSNRWTHREMERQRSSLDLRREKQRIGGKEGANRRYKGSKPESEKAIGQPMGSEKNRTEKNRAENKRNPWAGGEPFSGKEETTESCARDYADEEFR